MKFTLEGFDFFQLSLAYVGLHGSGELLGDSANHICTRAPGELGKLLAEVPRLLAPGGRFVVLSFHSGEDRMVKQSVRQLATAGIYRLLTRRVVRPAEEEVQRNPASRSARLRAVQRTEMAFSN